MITQVNGIGSNAALSKKPKAQMNLGRVGIPRDVAFTGAESKAADAAKGLFSKILDSKAVTAVKDFVSKYAKKAWGFATETIPKFIKKIPEYAGKAFEFLKGLLPKAKDAAGV